MSNKKERGFTLIELLVVIAVIGILAGVILASLGTSRNKGADAAIESELRQIQTQAALYYDTYKYYGSLAIGACHATTDTNPVTWSVFYDPTFKSIIEKAGTIAGGTVSGTPPSTTISMTACAGAADSQSFATAVQLKSSNATAWCVDSSGNSKLEPITANLPTSAMGYSGSVMKCK
ncbi:MAG TPA: type II secretion system protein [Candidatus Paceibacterota bacterium]|nr:type II secretion system protein [Candidatus Paceibacterota bacterium]